MVLIRGVESAPEVLCGEEYSKDSDYWSLGILLYELITGMPPFYDDNLENEYTMILEANPIFPSFLAISDNFKDFVNKVSDLPA